MSAMRATGITVRAGLSGSGTSGLATSTRGLPMPLVEPWPKPKPPRAEEVRCVGFERAHRYEFDAGVLGAAQPRLHGVGAGAARRDLAVPHGEAAERDDQARMLDDRRPIRDVAHHRLEGADHVG